MITLFIQSVHTQSSINKQVRPASIISTLSIPPPPDSTPLARSTPHGEEHSREHFEAGLNTDLGPLWRKARQIHITFTQFDLYVSVKLLQKNVIIVIS